MPECKLGFENTRNSGWDAPVQPPERDAPTAASNQSTMKALRFKHATINEEVRYLLLDELRKTYYLSISYDVFPNPKR